MSKMILAVDGGGIRGAAATQFLQAVEKQLQTQHQCSIRDCVDFYAGTSTGAIIALGLATTDLSLSAINDLYSYGNARKIFTENKGWFEIDGINAPKYEARGKTKLLKDNLGSAKLGDVSPNKHVLAVTYAVEQRRPVIIKSTNNNDRNLLSYKVADASSAAPTYFPTRPLDIKTTASEEYWLIDGGVIANNPTMCAISEVRKCWPETPMQDIRVLSVGTGFMTRKINGPASRKWGALQWVTKGHIQDILSDERVVAYQAKTITDAGNYIRVNAELRSQPGLASPPDDAMDDVSKQNIRRLKKLGDFWFQQYGQAAVDLLTANYEGPSLDRIDPKTGQPKS